MQFLVYEQDMLVLTDIYETLSDAYEAIIHKVSSVDDPEKVMAAVKSASVVFASITQTEFDLRWRDILSAYPDHPVVLIGNTTPVGFEAAQNRVFLPRPFTSEGLVNAAKSVLAALR